MQAIRQDRSDSSDQNWLCKSAIVDAVVTQAWVFGNRPRRMLSQKMQDAVFCDLVEGVCVEPVCFVGVQW